MNTSSKDKPKLPAKQMTSKQLVETRTGMRAAGSSFGGQGVFQSRRDACSVRVLHACTGVTVYATGTPLLVHTQSQA
jgi:hypothetical protein